MKCYEDSVLKNVERQIGFHEKLRYKLDLGRDNQQFLYYFDSNQ